MSLPLKDQVKILKKAVAQLMSGDCDLAVDTLIAGGFDIEDENFGYEDEEIP
jgi:hypothetical protein